MFSEQVVWIICGGIHFSVLLWQWPNIKSYRENVIVSLVLQKPDILSSLQRCANCFSSITFLACLCIISSTSRSLVVGWIEISNDVSWQREPVPETWLWCILIRFIQFPLTEDFFLPYSTQNYLRLCKTCASAYLGSFVADLSTHSSPWSCCKLGHAHEGEQKIRGDYENIFAAELLL